MTIEIDRYDYDADQRVLDQENEAKNAPKRSHTKKTSDQTGLLWTLSALALAACGGGGGGGGPVVTGPANTPSGANIPDSNQGNLSSLSGAPIGRISSDGAFLTDTNSDENGEFSLASPVIADALAQDGFLTSLLVMVFSATVIMMTELIILNHQKGYQLIYLTHHAFCQM